ncbi:MAG: PIG-L family deacetylase [Flavobacteriaceae bacterium]
MRKTLFLLLITISCFTVWAQKPKTPASAEIYESLQKLNFLGTVLYVAAHPDDENTRLISYLSNNLHARTAYLSLTRGDGGQNLIGTEIRELLGVIRTQELLEARRVDGGEQLFSRANDFGYSKHPDETFAIWNKNEVLNDVVLAIRQFRPDIIINRFDHRTEGETHGHHTASALLSLEAFDLAANKKAFPKQLETAQVWQPKRIFFNTSWWFYGSEEKFNQADKSNMLTFDIGVYYPLKGLSNNEVAASSRSKHLSQGFGALLQRGTQNEYIELLKGEPLSGSQPDIFEGIDTSWNRIKGGKAIGDILYAVEKNFNFKNPSEHLPQLIRAYKLLQNSNDSYWKALKTEELKHIIEMCAGLYLEASAQTPSSTANQHIKVNIEALNRSNQGMTLESISLGNGKFIPKQLQLKNNINENFQADYYIYPHESYTAPYWLNEKGTLGMYKVNDQNLIGKPETPKSVVVNFNMLINETPITFTKPVVYRYAKPDKGELYRPFEIIPEASVKIFEKVIFFNTNKAQDVKVSVKAGKDNIEGFLELRHPKGWNVFPERQNVSISRKGDEKSVTFTVTPPKTDSEGLISPVFRLDGSNYSKELIEINYEHIPYQTVLLPSESKVLRLNIKKTGNNIAYIAGAGDVVPESLQQIGYNVTTLLPENITPETLSQFHAVVMGIRAYNTVDALKFKQDILFDFIKQGGNMVVQYNTNRGLITDKLAPYPLTLSRDRVTDENAEVAFLHPEHLVLNFPNKITKQDFEGWTQERGLYFPSEWDDHFAPILSMHDKNETAKDGSLLIAQYGKGFYVYTGLSFFREFPEGVSGAYRLFANMLSLQSMDEQ